ncbi:restriction endonuclease subunit S [Micromonospora chalcea]|uniref:restriction endonuclease subunit S n=1 Tax=Micromonospora chalcea TaxID=1874 RepID=UPI003407BC2A
MSFPQTKLKYLCRLVAGGTPSVDVEDNWANGNDGYAWVSIGDMSTVDRVKTTSRRVSEKGVQERRLILGSPGTLLFSMYASLGHTAVLDVRGAWNQAILGLLPHVPVDMRFVRYSLISLRPHLAELARSNTQANLNAEQVGNLPIRLPSLDEQCRIANFLDRELMRHSALELSIAGRIEALAERRAAHFLDVVKQFGGPDLVTLDAGVRGDWKAAPLSKLLAQLTNGYVGPTRDLLVEEGVPYLQSLHIKNGKIDFQRRPYYVPDQWLRARPRIRLRRGDLLLVQTGALGEVALVDDEHVGSGCHALLIARPDCAKVSADFLWCLFRSSWGRSALIREQTGALHPHLEAGKVREIVIPVPPLRVQAAMVKECSEYSDEALRTEGISRRQLVTLAERRYALVTAAVTGEIDVTTARGADG